MKQLPIGKCASDSNVLLRLFRFAIAGGICTLLHFFLTNVAVAGFRLDPVLSSSGAYLTCVPISYLLQSRFTFRAKQDTRAQVTKFTIVSVSGLLVSAAVMKWAVEKQGLPYWAGAAVVAGAIPVVNFLVLSVWVFTKK
ncbi:GtrA family protein [Microvirga lupini]|uniref:GtrA family protein n=1 Tax=Microvirga lupini TaxID=420324 RepID=UPI00160F1D95